MKQKRDYSDYLRDILEMIDKVEEFARGMSLEQFGKDEKTNFAVVRAMEIIGEATKHIPKTVRNRHPKVPWSRMAGMRDKLTHGYFGVDLEIVWKTATHLLPTLRPLVANAVEEEIRRRGK